MRTLTRGFTLLEIIVAVSIMVMLAGFAVPLSSTLIRSAKEDATRSRLETLAKATYAYFEDTLSFPKNLAALTSNNGTPGWAGPYVTSNYVASSAATAKYDLDAFDNTIVFGTKSASTIEILSLGADHKKSTTDDIKVVVNVLPAMRTYTQERVDAFNAAIVAYNRARTDPMPGLSSKIQSAFSTLVSYGYLPNDKSIYTDAWKTTLIADPPNTDPLVLVKSVNMSSANSK